MEIVAGLNLVSIKPKVWDKASDYYLPQLGAVMVSYAQFHQSRAFYRRALEEGLHDSLGIPKRVKIYLDNGAFKFSRVGGEVPREDYVRFVEEAEPDWHVIPQDYIPTPHMTYYKQTKCLEKTMEVNQEFSYDGYVPILHVSRCLNKYIRLFNEDDELRKKPIFAIGGIVPNLLRAPKAMSHKRILNSIYKIRETFANQKLHLFGVGGTSTLHVAALLKMDSVDSVGWRTRAARGLVQLPGIGDRSVANLGNWKVRKPDAQELEVLKECQCPACQKYGLEGLKKNKTFGFCNRATHNLWTLLEENREIQKHLKDDTYAEWYKEHLHNSIYRPIIDRLVEKHLKG
jgi:queuine/archaeosine tRNA-ribosyltransferase